MCALKLCQTALSATKSSKNGGNGRHVGSHTSFAKAHADDYAIDLKKIDIAALLEDLCNDYKAAAKNVTSEIAGKIEINADMLNLRRALSNIIDNGLFYGTAVKLSLLTQQNNVIITIDDNGHGVDTGLLKDLVRPFFRSDTSRNNQSGGIGMGLALTKTVIERHRGTLDLQHPIWLSGLGCFTTCSLLTRSFRIVLAQIFKVIGFNYDF